MSGIEVVGLILGAFPLLISAMEHYEDSKKVTNIWWRFKRAHRKDLGKLKDCQLKFKLNLRELLHPLLVQEIVDQNGYEALLANPGGEVWKEHHVKEAFRSRLGESHERYIEICQEMMETMTALSQACLVGDADFQRVLAGRIQRASSSSLNQQAQTKTMLRPNVLFETKRIKYAFTSTNREDLLSEIGVYNSKLEDALASNDRVSALASAQSSIPVKLGDKMAKFRHHAVAVFRMVDITWTCQCRSDAQLRLQQQNFDNFNIRLQPLLCHGRESIRVCPTDTQISSQLRTTGSAMSKGKGVAITVKKSGNSNGPNVSLSIGRDSYTLFRTAFSRKTSTPGFTDIQVEGLCEAFSKKLSANGHRPCMVGYSYDKSNYVIYSELETRTSNVNSLTDFLEPASALRLNRAQRYEIALTLASSHLQLHSTPWMNGCWTSCDIGIRTYGTTQVPISSTGPFITTKFCHELSSASPKPAKDRSFSTLGIMLLELCFGRSLDHHPLWSNPIYTPGQTDPLLRQTVACEWLDDVQAEAGHDYAEAVTWSLRQAPAFIKDDGWRIEFLTNVVQPLQKSCKYLQLRL